MNRYLSRFAVSLAFLASACDGTTQPPTSTIAPTVKSVLVAPEAVTLVSVGEEVQFSASARDESGSTLAGKTFTWMSSDLAAATVQSSGLVTSIGSGRATISATVDDVTGSGSVTVALTRHETAVTGADGTVKLEQAQMIVEVVDLVTGDPIGGTQVTVVDDGADVGLLIFDLNGDYVPVIRLTEHKSESRSHSLSRAAENTALVSFLVRMIPRSLQDDVASFTVAANRTLVRYGRKLEWFECSETALDKAFTNIDVVVEGLKGSLEHFTLWAIGSAVGSAGVGAPIAAAIEGVGIASTVGSFSAIAFNQLIVEYYRALGYTGTDRFELCSLTAPNIGRFLDGLIILAPLENRPSRIGNASISGSITSATTSQALQAEVQLVGPSPRGLSTSDGLFEFTGLLPGSYVLTAVSPGYLPSALTVSLSVGEAAAHDVELSPGSVPEPPPPDATLPLLWPITQPRTDSPHLLSQAFAEFDDGSARRFHTGMDIRAEPASPVVAAAGGWVELLQKNDASRACSQLPCDHGMGNTVILGHRLQDGRVIYTQYSHLQDWSTVTPLKVYSDVTAAVDCTEELVSLRWTCTPQKVSVARGQEVGRVGGTRAGVADLPPHLHFESKPKPVLGAKANDGDGLDYGYAGSEPAGAYYDPIEFFHPGAALFPQPRPVRAVSTLVNIRMGPGGEVVEGRVIEFRSINVIEPSLAIETVAQVHGSAFEGCGDWYRIQLSSGSETRLRFEDRFDDVSQTGRLGELPTAWVCADLVTEEFFEVIADTYTGPVDETADGLRLVAVFTFNVTQADGILAGDYSISGTIGAQSVTGTGTLFGTTAVGTNPEVNITSTSGSCPNFSNEFRGTYDSVQGVITLTGTVHIFNHFNCTLIRAYPNTVITFTPQ